MKVYPPPPYDREVWSYGWESALSSLDTNEQVKLFNETLLNIFRNFIPHKLIKCSYKDPPWISMEIKTCLRKKNRLYKKYISNGCIADDLTSLNNHSNYCSDLISSAKISHFNKLANKLNDPFLGPKAYWSILNGFLGKLKIPMLPPETNFLSKANIFNEHFSNQ